MFLAASKHLRQLESKDEKSPSGDSKQSGRRSSMPVHRKHSSLQFPPNSDELAQAAQLVKSYRKSSSVEPVGEGESSTDKLTAIRSGQVTWPTIAKQITVNFNVLLAEVETMSPANLVELLTSLNDWLDYAECFIHSQYTETKALCQDLLIRLNEKAQFLKQYEAAVKTLLTILTGGSMEARLRAVVQTFSQTWNSLLELTESTVQSMTASLEHNPGPQVEQALQSLSEWLDCAEDVIATQDLDTVDQVDVTAVKIQRLKELQMEMGIQRDNLSFVVNATDHLLCEGLAGYETLSKKLSSLVPRWTDIERVLTNQLARLEAGFTMLNDWDFRASELDKWMVQVTDFIYKERPAVGNVDALKAQREQSQALMKDIETLVPKVQEMESWAHELQSTCTQRMADYIRARMDEIESRWNDIVRLTTAKHENLDEAYSKSVKTFNDISLLTQWLWNIEQEVQSLGTPNTGKELHALIKRHKQILEELHGKSETIENAVSLGEVMISTVDQSDETVQQLKKQFLNAREQWQTICQQMESRLSILSEAFEMWKEFQELIAAERISFDRLERILQEPMKSAADAEEFSEQLDEFERLMEGNGGHARILEISQALEAQKLLSNAVKADLNKYMARREEVLQPAMERQKFLENDARKAQNIEQQLHECLSWLTQVDFILKTRSECEIYASDVPDEYKQYLSSGQLLMKLYDEFDSHKDCIFRLEKQIAHYQQLDQRQAAERLAEQVNHLKKQMCDLRSKLEQYKEPSEYDDRVQRVRRILEDLQQSFDLLAVTSDDLEEIDQLLEKVEVTWDALNEIGGELADLRTASTKAGQQSTIEEVQDLQDAVSTLQSKVMESRDNFQSIKDMLTVSSTNLQACSELLNEVEADLRKSEQVDIPTSAEQSRQVLAHRRQVAECNKYLHDTQLGLQKFAELTNKEAAAELQNVLDILRRRVDLITDKLDEWALVHEKTSMEAVELQKKFFDLQADIVCELNLSESDIAHCGDDQSCIQVQLDHLKSLQPKIDSLKDIAAQVIDRDGDPLQVIQSDSGQLCRRWKGLMESTKDHLTHATLQSEILDQEASSVGTELAKRASSEEVDISIPVEAKGEALSEPVGSEEDDTTERLRAQTNELADIISSAETLLTESEKDFKQLKSKFVDVSKTVDACSSHVQQLMNRAANTSEIRPSIQPILSKLEAMNSRLKELTTKIQTLIDKNDRHMRKYDMMNSEAKTCLANLVFLDTMDKQEVISCQKSMKRLQQDLKALFEDTQREFAKMGVRFPDSSSDPLSKLLEQAQVKVDSRLKVLHQSEETKAKVQSFMEETAKVQDEFTNLERKLSSCSNDGRSSEQLSLLEQECEYQDVSKGVDSLKKRIEQLWEHRENVMSQVKDEVDQKSVQRAVEDLNTRLDSLEEIYIERFKKFEVALEDWQTLHQKLFSVMARLEQAEDRMKSPLTLKDPDAAKTAKSTLNDIRESGKTLDLLMDQLMDMKIRYAAFLSGSDVTVLTEKLNEASKRLHSLENRLVEDKNRLQRSDLEAKEELEELLFWLDETDALLTTSCDPTDAQQLEELKEKVLERQREVAEKVRHLENIVCILDELEHNENVHPALKASLNHEVEELRNRLDKVRSELESKINICEAKIDACHAFWNNLQELSAWTQRTKNLLLEYKSATIYTPARLDIEALEQDIYGKKVAVETFTEAYDDLRAEAENNEVSLGNTTEHAVKTLLSNWQAVLNMLEIFHSSSSSAISGEERSGGEEQDLVDDDVQHKLREIIALPTAEIRDISDFAQPSISEHGSINGGSLSDRASRDVMDDYSSLLSRPDDLGDQPSPLTPGKDLQQLIRWDHWLNDSTVEYRTFCKINDQKEIREALRKEQTFCSQLKNNRGKLMRILESEQTEDVQHKAELLFREWEKRIGETEARQLELNRMLEHCRRWDDLREEIKVFLVICEKKVSNAKVSDVPIEKLYKELSILEQLSLETDAYRRKMTDFNELSNFMVETYVNDDASTLSQMTSNLNTLWSKTNDNLRIRKAVLEASSRGRKDFFTAFNEFSNWLSKIETHLESLKSDSSMVQLLKDVAYRRELRDRWKGVSSEIEVHENVFHSLCDTANALLVNTICSDEKEEFQKELMRLCQRWEAAVKLSDSIRDRLNRAQEQWERLTTQLQELISWTEEASRELLRQQPLGGDFERLKDQNDFIQSLQGEISEHDKAVKEVIQLARSYLLQQDLRPSIADAADREEMQHSKRESRRIGQMIKSDSDRLEEIWAEFTENATSWQKLIEDTYTKMMLFDKAIDDCKAIMNEAEDLKLQWKSVGDVKLDELTESMERAKSYQQYLNCHIRLLLDDVNDHSSRLLADNVRLSPRMIHTLEGLNLRYKELEVAITNRIALLQHALRHFGPSSQHFLQGSVVHPWERAVSTNRVPYYINHETEKTQWDHPKMVDIVSSFSEFNVIRFSAYRTAIKLRTLQKNLYLDLVHIDDLIDFFNQKRLQDTNDDMMDVSEIVMTLLPIYELVQRENANLLRSVPLAVDLCLNWLLNVYDPPRTGSIRVICFKVALILLCNGPIADKYRYLFNQMSYNKRSLDQKKLALLLHECIQVPKFLGEVAAFGGTNIEPSVRSCFEKAKYPSEINLQQYFDWLNCEPQSIVWLPVMHRIAASENEKHQAKCNVCKMFPIVGLRYRCLKCFNFDICQNCFFAQRVSKSHKIGHPMQEYCMATKSGQDVRDFGKLIRNQFKSKHYWHKHRRIGYLPVQSVMEGHSLEARDVMSMNPDTQNLHSQVELYAMHLSEIERSMATETNESEDDEHAVISSLSSTLTSDRPQAGKRSLTSQMTTVRSPAQLISAADCAQKSELCSILRDLENENKRLVAEYERLRRNIPNGVDKSPNGLQNSVSTPMLPMTNGSLGRRGQHRSTCSLTRNQNHLINSQYNHQLYDETAMHMANPAAVNLDERELAQETIKLRQQQQRLEKRSRILEENNQQLEVQLRRIKQLIEEQRTSALGSESEFEQGKPLQSLVSSGASFPPDQMGSVLPTDDGRTFSESYANSSSNNGNRMGDLMNTAQDLGKAVGSLINAVTSDDDSASASEAD